MLTTTAHRNWRVAAATRLGVDVGDVPWFSWLVKETTELGVTRGKHGRGRHGLRRRGRMDGVSGASWNSGEVATDVYAARNKQGKGDEAAQRGGEADGRVLRCRSSPQSPEMGEDGCGCGDSGGGMERPGGTKRWGKLGEWKRRGVGFL